MNKSKILNFEGHVKDTPILYRQLKSFSFDLQLTEEEAFKYFKNVALIKWYLSFFSYNVFLVYSVMSLKGLL